MLLTSDEGTFVVGHCRITIAAWTAASPSHPYRKLSPSLLSVPGPSGPDPHATGTVSSS